MTGYQPQDGEECLVTYRATYYVPSGETPRFVLDGEATLDGMPARLPHTTVVRVEPIPKPALPTSVGSLIVAEVPGFAQLPVILHLTVRRDNDPAWIDTTSGTWVGAELIERWTLLDRDGLHTVDAPVALPTGLGAVVRTRNEDGEAGYATFTGDHPLPWRFRIPGYPGCTGWRDSSEVAAGFIEVLSQGIEVESP